MLILHVLQGPDRGKRFELPPSEPQLIGRSTEALRLTDSTISRRHAELTPDDGAWYLRDLASSNGCFVNGRRIEGRVQLHPGDQIRCGSTLFLFTSAGAAEKEPAFPIRLVDAEHFDTSIEGVAPAGNCDESMVLASPDPGAAATDHLRVIYQLTALTSGAFDRDALLGRVMDLVFAEFKPDRGFILLQEDPHGPPKHAIVRYRERPKTIDEGRVPVSRTIVQHTLERNEGVLSTNAMNDDRFRSGDSVRDYGIRSAICVPIRAGQHSFGVIHIDSQLANFTFSESQLRLLTAIGQHAGLALANLELVDSRLRNERLAAVGEAVASLSHSIKNILQGLRGGADAVELAINRNDLALARQGWPILSRNLDRIYNLTLNMLTYSKPRELEFDVTPLTPLIEEVAELIRPQAELKRAALVLDLDPDVPPIPVDANALHQALMNVLSNALEAVSSKTGVITLRTAFHADSREAVIAVSDNGPGVPSELRARIFEPFVSSKGLRGTGLGLAVTRKIVDEHDGRIEVESGPDGTTITITLPSDRPGLDAGETHQPTPMDGGDVDDF